MSDIDDLDDFDDERDDEDVDKLLGIEDEETEFDRTRTDYTGVRLDDEFQPVDEIELAEEGMLLDDPEHPSRKRGDLDPDDAGWDLDDDG